MPPPDRHDLFPGALEMMILQTLRLGPLHGYALAQSIKRASDDLVHVEEGSLYPALQRMLKAGWLSAEWGLSSRNRRVRAYKLTRDGRKQLERKVSAFERLLEGVIKVLRPAQ
ncbi:MAG: PadR family transcriptional regulator [Acidobacteriota bacterium]